MTNTLKTGDQVAIVLQPTEFDRDVGAAVNAARLKCVLGTLGPKIEGTNYYYILTDDGKIGPFERQFLIVPGRNADTDRLIVCFEKLLRSLGTSSMAYAG